MPSIATERAVRRKTAARRIVADALRFNWAGIEPAFAARCTVGVAIPLVVSALAGAPLAGASAAYGALVTGLATRQGVYRTRIGAALAAGLALALSAFVGVITGAHPAVNIALLAVWSLIFGLFASLGRAATVVSVNGCVAYVVFSNAPYDTANPAVQAGMVLGGCALQLVLLVLVWPLQRNRTERAAVAAAYAALAQYASGLAAHDLGLPDSQSFAALSATLADPHPFGSREELAAYQALADEAERMRATLAALVTEQHLLDEVGLSTLGSAVRAVSDAAAPILAALAAAAGAGDVPAAVDADWKRLDDAVERLERLAGGNAAPYVDDARALAGQLRGAVRSGAAAATGGLTLDAANAVPARLSFAPVRNAFDPLIANCSWQSVYALHAVRLAVTLTIAVIVQHLVPLAHAQWIGLTVVLVLRPDFSSTFTRGVGRVAGTVGGAILASLIAAFHPSEPAYVALAIAFAALGFALFNVSYALFSVAITGYVVYLLAFGGAAEHASAVDRVVATLAGGVLALVAYGLWPAWSRSHVADDLANLIDAQRRYLGLVLRAFVEPATDDGALRAAQSAVWRARTNAEAAVDQMAGEPVRPHGIGVRTANGILAATRRLGIAGLTLRGRIARVEGAPHAIVERFSTDLDTALRRIANAQRSGEAPEPLPPLRNDQIALKAILAAGRNPVVEVLVSETDLIVDGVNSLASLLARPR
jgi:uncharacterized membrane protein YccC